MKVLLSVITVEFNINGWVGIYKGKKKCIKTEKGFEKTMKRLKI